MGSLVSGGGSVPPPTDVERVEVHGIVKLLGYAGALDMVFIDLGNALVDAGLYRFGVKRSVRRLHSVLNDCNRRACSLLREYGGELSAQYGYNTTLEELYSNVFDNLEIPEPSKSYSIAVSFIRLIQKYHDFVGCRSVYSFFGSFCSLARGFRIDAIAEIDLVDKIDTAFIVTD